MQPGTIQFSKWDPDLARYVQVVRKGRVFTVDGKTIELFRVGVFAEALDRTSQSIERWHKEGSLPTPMFKVPGQREGARWYSKWQILNIAHLYVTSYDRKNKYFDKKKFLSEVRELWYKMEFTEGVVNSQQQAQEKSNG